MRTIAWTAGILGALLLVRELWIAAVPRRQQRRSLYAQAQARAHETGKHLVVLGAPDRGVIQRFAPDYGCGDLCVDQGACPCPTYIRGRIEDVLAQFADNSAVIFASDILETVDDAPLTAHHLDRVSGGDLFIATLDPTSLASWVWPGTRRRVLEAPPTALDIVYKPLPWHPEARPAPAHIIEMPNFVRRLQHGDGTIPTTAEPA